MAEGLKGASVGGRNPSFESCARRNPVVRCHQNLSGSQDKPQEGAGVMWIKRRRKASDHDVVEKQKSQLSLALTVLVSLGFDLADFV